MLDTFGVLMLLIGFSCGLAWGWIIFSKTKKEIRSKEDD